MILIAIVSLFVGFMLGVFVDRNFRSAFSGTKELQTNAKSDALRRCFDCERQVPEYLAFGFSPWGEIRSFIDSAPGDEPLCPHCADSRRIDQRRPVAQGQSK